VPADAPLPDRRLRSDVGFLLLLAGVLLVVYLPVADRVFAADQVWYFLELDGDHSLRAGLSHLDYSASRRYGKGDLLLFRPLLFVWLAVQDFLFRLDFRAWNLAHLGLHLAVCVLLHRLLRTVAPSGFAALFTLLFAVSYAHFEMIAWHHVGGYLAAVGLLLLALRLLLEIQAEPDRASRARLVGAVASLTAACFFHELMVPVSILVAACHALALRRCGAARTVGAAWPLLLPSVAYLTSYAVRCAAAGIVVAGSPADHGPGELAVNSAETLWAWLLTTVLPLDYVFGSDPYLRMESSPITKISGTTVLCAALYVLLPAAAFRASAPGPAPRRMPLVLLMGGTILAFAVLVNFGRPLDSIVWSCTYYRYFFVLFAVVGVCSLFRFEHLRGAPRVVAAGVLLTLIGINAFRSAAQSREVARLERDAGRYLRALDAFVREHDEEPGFTFAIDAVPGDLDPAWAVPAGPADAGAPPSILRISEQLYPRRVDRDRPRYLVSVESRSDAGVKLRIEPTGIE
jgi:hypothetical protein